MHATSTSAIASIAIPIPALPPPDPSVLRRTYCIVRIEEPDGSPLEPVTLVLRNALQGSESSIPAELYQARVDAWAPDRALGLSHALWLQAEQGNYPVLRSLPLEVRAIDFPATVGVDVDGERTGPYLVRSGSLWRIAWGPVKYSLKPGTYTAAGRFEAR